MERSTLRSIMKCLTSSIPSSAFHTQCGHRKPFSFLQEVLSSNRLPNSLPLLPRVPAQGQEAIWSPRYPQRDMVKPQQIPCHAHCSEMSPQRSVCVSLHLSSNTSAGFSHQKHLLWARQLLPALHGSCSNWDYNLRSSGSSEGFLVLPCSGIAVALKV